MRICEVTTFLKSELNDVMDATRVAVTGIRDSSNCSHEVRNLKLKRSGGSSDVQGNLSIQMMILVSSRFLFACIAVEMNLKVSTAMIIILMTGLNVVSNPVLIECYIMRNKPACHYSMK